MKTHLQQLQADWTDTAEFHAYYHNLFCILVNDLHPELKKSRDWVEQNCWGFGERSFWYLWMVICEELPKDAKMLEIGVLKGATLSLWKTLKPKAEIYGITPLDTTGGVWESDYEANIKLIHSEFNLKQPTIINGLSEHSNVIEVAKSHAPYDCLYIDGGHERRHIDNDLLYYAPMVKSCGYLVIDDACNDMHMPFGYFQGIQDVTDGVLSYMAEHGEDWEFVFNVVHLRVYKRK